MNISQTKNTVFTLLYAAGLILFMPLVTVGQEFEEIEFPPRFQVELVIFRQLYPTPGNEQFEPPYDPLSSKSLNELDALLSLLGDQDVDGYASPISDSGNKLRAEAGEVPGNETNAEDSGLSPALTHAEETNEEIIARQQPQIVVDEEQWQMRGIIDRIDNSRDFQILLHQVWQQDGVALEASKSFNLRSIENDAGVLDGTATLSMSRFLHLLLEINWLPNDKKRGTPLYGRLFGLMKNSTPYSINESRLMHRGEFHYFDHPYFGAVAVVTAVEEPEPDQD
jgi:hypothetical protein